MRNPELRLKEELARHLWHVRRRDKEEASEQLKQAHHQYLKECIRTVDAHGDYKKAKAFRRIGEEFNLDDPKQIEMLYRLRGNK